MDSVEKVKKISVALQYVPAVTFFFFAFSFWRDGSTTGALIFGLTGIGFILLPVLLNIIRKNIDNDRHFMILSAAVVFCFAVYNWIQGDIYDALFSTLICIFIVSGQLLAAQKYKGTKWASPIWQIYIPIAVVLITFGTFFYLENASESLPATFGAAAGVQQQPVDASKEPNKVSKGKITSSPAPRMQQTIDMMNRMLSPEQRKDPTAQKMMEIMASESFQQQLEQQNPETPQEILQLFAQHGLTEAKEIDFDKILAEGQQRFEKAYKARNPGKDPAKEDDAMADRFAESMKLHGPIGGMAQFMRDTENVEWINFRFKDDPKAYNAWKNQVRRRFEMGIDRVNSESEGRVSQALASTGVESTPPLQQEIPISESAAQDTSVELEAPIIPDTADRAKTPLVVEPEKVVTQVSPSAPVLPTDEEIETTLKERFSSERFDRAMDTLERYGEEEGLRRLRESDPEIAKQIESSRRDNREHPRDTPEGEESER